ncbi:hypothetical protein ABT168_34235 [Streptomyces sp. NPDC001793]|uniref:hypothetical protein n=1 Tax=Streptomyces sp. NPDC001793 TaxID=3154657 RepID=UPI00331677E4
MDETRDGAGGTLRIAGEGTAEIGGLTRFQVGDLAAERGVPLYWLGMWRRGLRSGAQLWSARAGRATKPVVVDTVRDGVGLSLGLGLGF